MEHEASLKQAFQRLSELEIFEGLSELQLKELVAVGEISECPEDVVLFKEGDVGDKMYLIIEGSLEVTTEADHQVFLLNAGNVLGEIGLLDGLPRTATVTTASPCQLFGLSREHFESFISLDPKIAIGIMQVTNRKTRDALGREKELNASLREANAELERLNRSLESMVEQKTQQLLLANQNLKEMIDRDALTGAYNRRKFDSLLEELVGKDEPFSLVMLDLDHFKSINDTHGHQTGDRVLIKLAEVAGDRLSGKQYLARYGGEEFGLILENCELELAGKLAESVRHAVETHHFPIRGCSPGYVTASLGVSQFPLHGKTVAELVECADKALYQAKTDGRNRVVLPGGKVDVHG